MIAGLISNWLRVRPCGQVSIAILAEKARDYSRTVPRKTGRLRDGSIRFAVCSTYGHYKRPGNVRRDYRGQIDCFAVFCPETAGVYLIPIDDISTRSTAYLRHDPPKNAQRAKIRFAADYEIGRVAIGGLRVPSGA